MMITVIHWCHHDQHHHVQHGSAIKINVSILAADGNWWGVSNQPYGAHGDAVRTSTSMECGPGPLDPPHLNTPLWNLPNMDCSVTGSWASTSITLPSLQISVAGHVLSEYTPVQKLYNHILPANLMNEALTTPKITKTSLLSALYVYNAWQGTL